MSFFVIDPTTAAAVTAASTQRAELESLAAPWAGGAVTVRWFAGTTLLRTQTLPALALNTVQSPYRITLGRYVADTHIATGTADRVVLRAGSTDIVQADVGGTVTLAGAIKELCPPDLSAVSILGNVALPAGPPNMVVLTDDGMLSNSSGASLQLDGAVFLGCVTQNGPLVVKHDLTTGVTTEGLALRPSIGNSDHSAPGVVARSDGRLYTVYSRHNLDTHYFDRVSTNPGDVTTWNAERTLSDGAGEITYPFVEKCGAAGWLTSYRNQRSWRYKWSLDEGVNWSTAATFATYDLANGGRVYVIPLWNPSLNRVDLFMFAQNSGFVLQPYIWFAYATVSGSTLSFFKADGTPLSIPFDSRDTTVIYDGTASGVLIVPQDIAHDPVDGSVWLMVRKIISASSSEVLMMRGSGASWTGPHFVYNAGSSMSGPRTDYVPGACFKAGAPSLIAGMRSESNSGRSRLAEYQSTDSGVTWTKLREITPWSAEGVEMFRPGRIPGGTKYTYAWVSGRFDDLTDWAAEIQMGA